MEATFGKRNQAAFCALSLQITSESSVRESVAWGSGQSILNYNSAEPSQKQCIISNKCYLLPLWGQALGSAVKTKHNLPERKMLQSIL